MDVNKVKKAVNDCVAAMYRIQGEKDFIKATVDTIADSEGLDKKKVNAFIKHSYKNDLIDLIAELEETKAELEQMDLV